MVCLMPSAVQVIVAFERPDRALGVAVVGEPDIVDVDVSLHPLGLADLIAPGADRDVAVVTCHVLQQKWAGAERY